MLSPVKITALPTISLFARIEESLFTGTPYKEPSFGQAFKEARKSKVDAFEWKGKTYHTKYKEEVKTKAESFLDRWKKSCGIGIQLMQEAGVECIVWSGIVGGRTSIIVDGEVFSP